MIRKTELDGLRGWLLIMIACNHLWGNFVRTVTHQPFGFFSAAESFVMLSGFVAYLVYFRYAHDKKQLMTKIWQRAAVIYAFHVIGAVCALSLTQIFPVFTEVWTEHYLTSNWQESPWRTLLLIMALIEMPAYHDILVVYMVPMIFLPLAILAIERGKIINVIVVSTIIWGASHWVDSRLFDPLMNEYFSDMKRHHGFLNILSWQWYFFLGVFLSALRNKCDYRFEFSIGVKGVLITLAFGMMLMKHLQIQMINIDSLHTLNANVGMAWSQCISAINLVLFAYLFKLIFQHWKAPFVLQFPVFLGQHALPVFAFHSVVLFFIAPAVEPWVQQYWWADVMACLAFVGLLYIPAKLDALYKSR